MRTASMTDDQAREAQKIREVRAGFGRLAIGVAVISTLDDKRPHGCTGMAWAEHAAPPLILTTLRTGGRTRELVGATGLFGVNVLSEQQRELARAFAARSAEPGDRFSGASYAPGPVRGVPLLDGCAASFECEVEDIYPFGGHDIVVGTVRWAAAGEGLPLAHCDGHLWGLRETGK
jgi:3-hydroxy-9,10-secoandrosta-1,3,5(10)-triene-9,17-dione monooxygenase reductase component